MNQKFDLSYQTKTLEQFESYPYPDAPLETSPKNDIELLYKNSLVTAFYHRDRRVIKDLSQFSILDLACGTGCTTLALAEANPDAQIVAVDISAESIKLAEKRLKYHGFEDVEYHVIALEEISHLGTKFDYINASDILYLLPDISIALQHLGAVLKPEGIIRSNLHSYYQRFNYYRAQSLFQRMGLLDNNPGDVEMEIVREFFSSLKDEVNLKARTWGNQPPEAVRDETILMNYLFQNDKGFTLPQLFDFLRQADLEFVDMVDWREWNLLGLFKNVEDLPAFIAMGLDSLDREEELCLYELINPHKRLLDFWCCHPQNNRSEIAKDDKDWKTIQVYLHPQLQYEAFRQEILSPHHWFPVNLKDFIPFLAQEVWLDRTLLGGLFVPLLESGKSMDFLVQRWLALHPLNPVTLEPIEEGEAFSMINQAVTDQEKLGIILVE